MFTSEEYDELVKKIQSSNQNLDKKDNKSLTSTVVEKTPFLKNLTVPFKAAEYFLPQTMEQVQRTTGGGVADIGRELLSLSDLGREAVGLGLTKEEKRRREEEVIAPFLRDVFGEESVEMSRRGDYPVAKVSEPTFAGGQTIRDIGAFIGSMVVGGKGIGQASKVIRGKKPTSFVGRGAQGIAAGEIAAQVSLNPYDERLGDMLAMYVGDDNETLQAIADFLKSDENKSELENRMGLLVEGLALSGVITGGILVVPSVLKQLKKIKKAGDNYTDSFLSVINKNRTKTGAAKTPKVTQVEDIKELSTNRFSKFFDSVLSGFRQRGQFTPEVFEVIEKSRLASEAMNEKGVQTGLKLERLFKEFLEKNPDVIDSTRLNEIVIDYLTGNKKAFQGQNLKGQAQIISDLSAIRKEFDDYSKFISSRLEGTDVEKIINTNLGKYLRESYELYRNQGFQPSKQIIADAEDYILSQLKNQKKYQGRSEAELKIIAKNQVDTIVQRSQDRNIGAFETYVNDIIKTNKSLFMERKEIAEPIRALLGETKDPIAKVFRTFKDLGSEFEKFKAYDEILELGQEGRYILDEPTELGVRQIIPEGYGSLSGKYTTKGMVDWLTGNQQSLVDKIGLLNSGGLYSYILGAKGFGQAAATVFNHITHLRNVQGGFVMMVQNGLNPFNPKHYSKLKSLKAKFNVSDEAANQEYLKYTRLGVVGTAVRAGDTKALLDDAVEAGSLSKWTDNVLEKTKVGKVGKKIYDATNKLYIAEDDLFKILTFENELDTLIKAARRDGVEITEEVVSRLESQAAKITRDIMPSYDKIPINIRDLRRLPIGNFVSFQAERVRNNLNILKYAVRDLTSDNAVLRDRAFKRLTGQLLVTAGASSGLNYATKKLNGVTDEEEEAFKNLLAPSWGRHGQYMFFRDKDGNLMAQDLSYTDPNDSLTRVFRTYINEFTEGKRTESELSEIFTDATAEALTEFLSPFFDEAILSKAIFDATIYNGENVKGWREQREGDKDLDVTINNLNASTKHILKTLIPGGIRAGQKLIKSLKSETSDFGKELNVRDELFTNLTGFRQIRYTQDDIAKSLRVKLNKDGSFRRNLKSDDIFEYIKPSIKAEEFLNELRFTNKQGYDTWVSMRLAVDAAEVLGMTRTKISGIIDDVSGLSKEDRRGLKNYWNFYNPIYPTFKQRERALDTLDFSTMSKTDFLKELGAIQRNLSKLPNLKIKDDYTLDLFSEEQESKAREELRKKNFQGGKIKGNENNYYDYRSFTPTLSINPRQKDTSQTFLNLLNPKPLIKKSEVGEKISAMQRFQFVEGGLIEGEEVPFTEENPADRINPLTGEPYSETSQGVLATLKEREETRVLETEGGLLKNLQRRKKFASGAFVPVLKLLLKDAAKGKTVPAEELIKALPDKVYRGGTRRIIDSPEGTKSIFAASDPYHAQTYASPDAPAKIVASDGKSLDIPKSEYGLNEIDISSAKKPYVLDAPTSNMKFKIKSKLRALENKFDDINYIPTAKDDDLYDALGVLLGRAEGTLTVGSGDFARVARTVGEFLRKEGFDLIIDTPTLRRGYLNNPEAELYVLENFPTKAIDDFVPTKRTTRQASTVKVPTWFRETKVKTDVDPADAQKTQVGITSGTYKKVVPLLKEGNTLDFGAGLGKGAKILKADSYEPFPKKGFEPTFTETSEIPNSSYDNVVSLNVLNVVKPDVRNNIVLDIGRILKPKGSAIITTRGSDIFGNKNNITKGVLSNLEEGAIITSSGTYQKGFTNAELKEYVSNLLGDMFEVENITGLGKAGIKVTKL